MGIWQVFGYGALGGFLNCILFTGGFVMPKIVHDEGHWICQPGFLGNIIMGAAAGFLIDVFMASELGGNKELALVLLGGVGGGNVLISLLQQHIIRVKEEKAEALAKVAKEVTQAK
jgi:hypothetical protein